MGVSTVHIEVTIAYIKDTIACTAPETVHMKITIKPSFEPTAIAHEKMEKPFLL